MRSYKFKIINKFYEWITNGTKRIEIRLYNDKTSKINIGDYLTFTVTNDETKKIKAQVTGLFRYKNINDLLEDFDVSLVSDKNMTPKKLEDMFVKIYGTIQLSTHEIIGIKFKIIDESELLISENIDKEVYCKRLTKDKIINITGESGSGKSTYVANKFNTDDYVIVDTDLIFGDEPINNGLDKYLRKYFYDEYKDKYKEALFKDFDKVYLMILNYFKNNNKTIVIDSAQFRNIKDISILKGDIIVHRTSIDTCYERCINRYKERNIFATEEMIKDFSNKKRQIYNWYHSINDFIIKLENYEKD